MAEWQELHEFDKYKVYSNLYYRYTSDNHFREEIRNDVEFMIENNGMSIVFSVAGGVLSTDIEGNYYKDREQPLNAAARKRVKDISYWAFFVLHPWASQNPNVRNKQWYYLNNHMYKLWRDLRSWHYRKQKYDVIEVNGMILQ